MKTVTGEQIVDAARSFVGTPFHHQGRSRAGMDCAGLPILTARALGLEPEDNVTYSMRPDSKTLLDTVKKSCSQVMSLEPGTLLIWVMHDSIGFEPTHLSIRTGLDTHIHVLRGRRVAEESMLPEDWDGIFHSAWRYRWHQ